MYDKEAFARGVYGDISCLPHGSAISGEDIRRECTALNIVPTSPYAWGGIILSARRRGLVEDTGAKIKMTDPTSNERLTPILRVSI